MFRLVKVSSVVGDRQLYPEYHQVQQPCLLFFNSLMADWTSWRAGGSSSSGMTGNWGVLGWICRVHTIEQLTEMFSPTRQNAFMVFYDGVGILGIHRMNFCVSFVSASLWISSGSASCSPCYLKAGMARVASETVWSRVKHIHHLGSLGVKLYS